MSTLTEAAAACSHDAAIAGGGERWQAICVCGWVGSRGLAKEAALRAAWTHEREVLVGQLAETEEARSQEAEGGVRWMRRAEEAEESLALVRVERSDLSACIDRTLDLLRAEDFKHHPVGGLEVVAGGRMAEMAALRADLETAANVTTQLRAELAAVEALNEVSQAEYSRGITHATQTIKKLDVALERVARCLITPNPGIKDTIWLDPAPKTLSPTLYEFICGVLGREVKPHG